MRVLINVTSLSGGGAEFVAVEWARYLAQAGDCVTLYTTHSQHSDVAPDGVALVQAGSGNFVRQTRDLAKYLNSESQPTDIVVGLSSYSNLMSIAATRVLGARRPKIVISQHLLAHGPRAAFDGSYRAQQWLARQTYRYSDLMVAVSHPVGAEAIAEYGLATDRVTVVPNPAFAKMQDRVARGSVGSQDPSRLNVIVAGRLVPQKRPLMAVEVAARMASTSSIAVTLHFFGVGPLHDEIVARAGDLGVNLVMHGWVEDWFDQCPAGSIVLLTSVLEGFGNVLIEAAAAGLRSVVSSRCMGAADAVLPGITGQLIAGDSVDEYAAAVLGTPKEPVRDVNAWLQRFSSDSGGSTLRAALVRTAKM